MRKSNKNIALYLLLIVGLWAFCFVTLKLLLMPYSIAYTETGKMTAGYFCYAAIGLLFSTPAPLYFCFDYRFIQRENQIEKVLKMDIPNREQIASHHINCWILPPYLAVCAHKRHLQRLLVGYVPSRMLDYDTVCRDC